MGEVRRYRITLKTVGLVHIGNGEQIGKKEYFRHGDKIAVLNATKFVKELSPERFQDYLDFLGESSSRGLQDFLKMYPDLKSAANKSIAYQTETDLARNRGGRRQNFSVFKFVKDPYGCPYVPGSSMKGMLRTVLMVSLILNNREKYADLFDKEIVYNKDTQKKADKKLNRKVFWLEQPDKHDFDAINDIMRYVSVSDSAPLACDDLVFAKKYDKFAKSDDGRYKHKMGNLSDDKYYEGNELNIYRECLRPGTEVMFSLDIDSRIDSYLPFDKLDAAQLQSIFRQSYELHEENFLSNFETGENGSGDSSAKSNADDRCRYIAQSGPLAGSRCPNHAVNGTGYCNSHQHKAAEEGRSHSDPVICYLGGGVDFDSKTVVNAFFDNKMDRVNAISHILYEQFPTRIDDSKHGQLWRDVEEAGFKPKKMRSDYNYRTGRLKKAKDDHRHWRDTELGVSPHTLKFGIVGSKRYLMGKSEIRIEKRP